MKAHFIVRAISLLSYFSIYLMGMIIGIPFICYLFVMPLFGWDTPSQPVSALLALFGLCILLSTYIPKIRSFNLLKESIIFILLLSPVAERLLSVPLVSFGYAGFIVPLIAFLILYPISIYIRRQAQKPKVVI